MNRHFFHSMLIDNEERVLHKGETLFISAKTAYSILEMQNGTIWLAVHIR